MQYSGCDIEPWFNTRVYFPNPAILYSIAPAFYRYYLSPTVLPPALNCPTLTSFQSTSNCLSTCHTRARHTCAFSLWLLRRRSFGHMLNLRLCGLHSLDDGLRLFIVLSASPLEGPTP